MSTPRNLTPLVCWTALGLVLGVVGAIALPEQYLSNAELAVESEALSPAGLARFDRLSLADGVEVATSARRARCGLNTARALQRNRSSAAL